MTVASGTWGSPPKLDAVPPIRVLIAEDETHLGTILEQFLTARGFAVQIVRDGRAALEALRTDAFDVALLDVVMPELDGLETLRLVREGPLPPEIIVMTGNGTIETAMAAFKLGAYGVLSKPYRMAEIEALVHRAWEKRVLARDNQRLTLCLHRAEPRQEFVTRFAPLTAVLSLVDKIATSPSPVLVSGESGTGKALLAQQLHRRGRSHDAPFVRLSCAPAHLDITRQLRGVEQGTAGVASVDREIGLFELASGGTLLLSHIDQLDAAQQALVLEVLDTGRVLRIGGAQPLPVQVRLVASTTHELEPLVRAGRFSEALVHRINAVRFVLPPLRERRTDIALLAEHCCARIAQSEPRRATCRVSDAAIALLEQYDWPGNVRELRNVVERAVLLAEDGVIGPEALPFPRTSHGERPAPPSAEATDGPNTVVPTLATLERQHIADVLERTQWHQGHAAGMLGISAKTLYRKIREYGFTRPAGRTS